MLFQAGDLHTALLYLGTTSRAVEVGSRVAAAAEVCVQLPSPCTASLTSCPAPLLPTPLLGAQASDMVMHPAPGHYTGTLVNALLHHCQLPAMQLAQGGAAPLSLEGAAAAAAAAREDASSSGREGDAGASSSGSGGADDERLDQHAAAAAADAAAGQAAGHSGPAASASALASASTSAGPAEQSELEGDEDDDEGGGLLLVGPAGSAGGATIRPGVRAAPSPRLPACPLALHRESPIPSAVIPPRLSCPIPSLRPDAQA